MLSYISCYTSRSTFNKFNSSPGLVSMLCDSLNCIRAINQVLNRYEARWNFT